MTQEPRLRGNVSLDQMVWAAVGNKVALKETQLGLQPP